jgi:carboxyl-terminal processing protease
MKDVTHRTRWLVFAVSTPLVVLVAVGALIGAAPPEPQAGFAHLRVFEDVVSLITSSYVEEVDIDPVMDGAMRGLADGLDAESAYLTPTEVETLDAGTPPGPADVGLVIARQFYLRVVGVGDDSPAARAGLRTGDYIRAIDGTPTRAMSAFRGARLLSGAPGSTVTLLVIRTNAADPHEMTLTREAPKGALVSGNRLDEKTALIRVHRFEAGTAEAIRKASTTLAVSSETTLLLDVRGVAGGTAADAVAAARLFVKYGPLATSAGRDGKQEAIAPEPGDGSLTMPLIVLVSNGTAHAAELFAAAVQGNDRAKLVGEPTPGLAGEQKLFRLPAGHGLWMTYRRYLTVKGDPIHGQGLDPDVPVAVPVVDFGEPLPATDAVLERARELARPGAPTAR